MNSTMLFRTAGILFTGAVLSIAFIMDSADARERHRSGSYATGKGKTGTYKGSVRGNLRDGLTRDQSVTTEGGKVFNRSAATQYNKDTGEYNKSVTGANGATRSIEGTAAKGERSGTYNTSTGKSGTFDSTINKNADGSVTRNDSWTNQDGETKTRSATTDYDKDTNTANRSVTGPGGKTRDGSVTVIPDSH